VNNKKITIIFILVSFAILVGVGVTFAYFTSSTDFENEFQTGLYQTEATETFTSPQNWMPGDETPKELTITNTGNVDVKARVCISEEWTSSNDDTLPNEVNGESMAIINLDNTSDWTKKGNCYEYNDVLEPNDVTSSFIQSVTFNPNATADLNCTTTTSNGTTTKTCTSSGDGYDNATYKLTLRVETVQANKASELWPDYVISYTTGSTSIGSDPTGLTTYNTQQAMLEANNGYPFYLKHKVEYGEVTESYVEFVITEEMAQNNTGMTPGTYSLRGAGATYDDNNDYYNEDSPYYLTNKTTLQTAFGVSNCTDHTNWYECSVSGLSAYADAYGIVRADDDDWYCLVISDGYSDCVYA